MIWLTGSQGMLGRLVATELSAAGLPFHATDREVDLTDHRALAAGAPPEAPAWVINCAAYTAVDRAESEREAAWALNCDAVAHLARYCSTVGARMVHISTDYVFDGERPHGEGYHEEAPVNPQSVYGRSKAAGEGALREELAAHLIIRTAWLYAEHGHNFLLTMLRLLAQRQELTVVNDQHGCPTYARDLAGAIVHLIGCLEPPTGTVHFTNAGVTTWYDYACRIQQSALELGLLPVSRTIVPVSSDQYPTAAQRPACSVLECRRIREQYAITPRAWQQALDDCLARLAADSNISLER